MFCVFVLMYDFVDGVLIWIKVICVLIDDDLINVKCFVIV